MENPALEEGREESAADEYSDVEGSEDGMDNASTDYDSLNDYLTEDDIPDYKLQENNRSQDDQPENIPFSESTSFYEILKEQLGERNLTEHQNELVEYLIGSLDDDGLLRKSLESICDELAIYAGVEGQMVNAIKLSENEANEIIAKYLRTISNIVDAKLNSNMYGYTITDTLDCHGKSFKRLREIKLLDYMSLLKLSLKSEGHNVDMIKQVSEKNENNEYETIYICYVDLLKRGR